MRSLASGAAAVGTALAIVAACGGGGGSRSNTTAAPPPDESTTTSAEPTTTSTTIDPALEELLLVAEDLTGFRKQADPEPEDPNEPRLCDPSVAPAQKVLDDGPSADGPTLARESNEEVEVSSFVAQASPEEARAAMDELLDPKVRQCAEERLKMLLEQDAAQPGVTYAVKTTSSRSTVGGVEQAVVLASTITAGGSGATRTIRADIVLLRSGGTVLGVDYFGPSSATSVAERQRIVAVAARKLAATGSGTSTTAAGGGSTSSTSASRRTSTTRRSTSTTRDRSTTSSSRSSSTTGTTG